MAEVIYYIDNLHSEITALERHNRAAQILRRQNIEERIPQSIEAVLFEDRL